MYRVDRDSIAASCAIAEAAIEGIRGSLPPPPWSARTHTDLAPGMRPACDWQLERVEVTLRLVAVSRTLEVVRKDEDAKGVWQLLDDVERELRDLGTKALPELRKAIKAHDEAAKRQFELEELREGCRRSRDRWARSESVLGFIAERRRDARDDEIREIEEQLGAGG